jgi:hypothetical protein
MVVPAWIFTTSQRARAEVVPSVDIRDHEGSTLPADFNMISF